MPKLNTLNRRPDVSCEADSRQRILNSQYYSAEFKSDFGSCFMGVSSYSGPIPHNNLCFSAFQTESIHENIQLLHGLETSVSFCHINNYGLIPLFLHIFIYFLYWCQGQVIICECKLPLNFSRNLFLLILMFQISCIISLLIRESFLFQKSFVFLGVFRAEMLI